jgi:hypothetical protein
MPRDKTPEEVRRSALTMAVRTYRSGCAGCAERYLSLARSNGASEEEVAALRAWMAPPPGAAAPPG